MTRLVFKSIVAIALATMTRAGGASGHSLRVVCEPRFAGAPLIFDTLTNTTAGGQQVSVTRLDFLLSNISLRRAEGDTWLGLTNWFAFLSPREGRTSFELNNIPAGTYDRVRFNVGVPSPANHGDPANYPSQHPLNPNLNGLHWNWQGGYVFLAIEGQWRGDHAGESGYSYHVANDRLLMTVELPVTLALNAERELDLALNVDRIFSGKHRITITDDNTSTHSREPDPLTDQLRDNIQHAFSVQGVGSPKFRPLASTTNRIDIALDATPYQLDISRFFPRPSLPLDNPLTEEGVRLGALLFTDPRLSVNNSQSCASCHELSAAFTDGKAVSIGARGEPGERNAMPLFNLGWKSSFFWDGRAPSLREQVLQPIEHPLEMHETLTNAVRKVHAAQVNPRHQGRAARFIPGNVASPATEPKSYGSLFAQAFDTPDVTADRIARALEQFLLVQVSHQSKFDKTLRGEATLTQQEKRGFELFNTEYDPRRRQFGADCFHCHGGPLFQSQSFANNGLDTLLDDPGRYLVTGKSGDRGKFAVPSLRNVAVTAPYMHDGRFATLEEVVEHYTAGVKRSATLDPNLAKHPHGGVPLGASDKEALIAFLKTLTDNRFLQSPIASARHP